MLAPSASADSFAQTTEGATALLTNAKVCGRSRQTPDMGW